MILGGKCHNEAKIPKKSLILLDCLIQMLKSMFFRIKVCGGCPKGTGIEHFEVFVHPSELGILFFEC